jgi:hypothetical protein
MSCGCGHRSPKRYQLNPNTNTATVVPGNSALIMNRLSEAKFDGVNSSASRSTQPRTSLTERVNYWAASRGQISPSRQRSALFSLAPAVSSPQGGQYDGGNIGPISPPPSPAPSEGPRSLTRFLAHAIIDGSLYQLEEVLEEGPTQPELDSTLRLAATQGLTATSPLVQALLRAGANPETARNYVRQGYQTSLRNLDMYGRVGQRIQSTRPGQ